MLKQTEKEQLEAVDTRRSNSLQILCLMLFLGGGCYQLVMASVVTDFNTEGAAWLNDAGTDGLTKIDLVIRDDLPIKIDFAEYKQEFPDENFSFFISTKIPQGLSNLHFRWEKEQINLDDAPHYLGFNYLTREPSSSTVTNVNSGTNFHELWFDFSHDISAGGAMMLNFNWENFNLPDNGEFSLSIGINEPDTLFEEDVSIIPVPAAIWFFATGVLGIVVLRGKKQKQNYF